MAKRYKLKSSCPQCGCSEVAHLSKEELKKRYGDVENIELECHECTMAMETEVAEETKPGEQ